MNTKGLLLSLVIFASLPASLLGAESPSQPEHHQQRENEEADFTPFNPDRDSTNKILRNAAMMAMYKTAIDQHRRLNDPSLKLSAQLSEKAKQFAIDLAVNMVIGTAIALAFEGVKELGFKAYTNLPFEACRNIKRAQELAEHKAYEMQEAQRKLLIQKTLKDDTKLLQDSWTQLENIKRIRDEEQDQKIKEQLSNLYQTLKKRYAVTAANTTDLVSMNLAFQPVMTSFASQMYAQMKDDESDAVPTANTAAA